MSFGFSISDGFLLGQLAWNTWQNSKKACGEHDELTREAWRLHMVLQRLEHEVSKPESPINRPGDITREQLRHITRDCGHVLRQLDRLVKGYAALSEEKRSGRKIWQRVKFGNGQMADLGNLRTKVISYTAEMSFYLNMASLGTVGRIARQMAEQGGMLRDIQVSINRTTAHMVSAGSREGSMLTAYADDDSSVWRELRRELIREGYPSYVIRRNKHRIKAYVKELGDSGLLDDVSQALEEYRDESNIGDVVEEVKEQQPDVDTHDANGDTGSAAEVKEQGHDPNYDAVTHDTDAILQASQDVAEQLLETSIETESLDRDGTSLHGASGECEGPHNVESPRQVDNAENETQQPVEALHDVGAESEALHGIEELPFQDNQDSNTIEDRPEPSAHFHDTNIDLGTVEEMGEPFNDAVSAHNAESVDHTVLAGGESELPMAASSTPEPGLGGTALPSIASASAGNKSSPVPHGQHLLESASKGRSTETQLDAIDAEFEPDKVPHSPALSSLSNECSSSGEAMPAEKSRHDVTPAYQLEVTEPTDRHADTTVCDLAVLIEEAKMGTITNLGAELEIDSENASDLEMIYNPGPDSDAEAAGQDNLIPEPDTQSEPYSAGDRGEDDSAAEVETWGHEAVDLKSDLGHRPSEDNEAPLFGYTHSAQSIIQDLPIRPSNHNREDSGYFSGEHHARHSDNMKTSQGYGRGPNTMRSDAATVGVQDDEFWDPDANTMRSDAATVGVQDDEFWDPDANTMRSDAATVGTQDDEFWDPGPSPNFPRVPFIPIPPRRTEINYIATSSGICRSCDGVDMKYIFERLAQRVDIILELLPKPRNTYLRGCRFPSEIEARRFNADLDVLQALDHSAINLLGNLCGAVWEVYLEQNLVAPSPALTAFNPRLFSDAVDRKTPSGYLVEVLINLGQWIEDFDLKCQAIVPRLRDYYKYRSSRTPTPFVAPNQGYPSLHVPEQRFGPNAMPGPSGPPPPDPGYPPNERPELRYTLPRMCQQEYPPNMMPSQGYPPDAMPYQGYPPNTIPNQGYPANTMPNRRYPFTFMPEPTYQPHVVTPSPKPPMPEPPIPETSNQAPNETSGGDEMSRARNTFINAFEDGDVSVDNHSEVGTTVAHREPREASPSDEFNNILRIFTFDYLPQCTKFVSHPPSNAKKRSNLYRSLGESILTQVLLKLDAIEAAENAELKTMKKNLINSAQATLTNIDEAEKKATKKAERAKRRREQNAQANPETMNSPIHRTELPQDTGLRPPTEIPPEISSFNHITDHDGAPGPAPNVENVQLEANQSLTNQADNQAPQPVADSPATDLLVVQNASKTLEDMWHEYHENVAPVCIMWARKSSWRKRDEQYRTLADTVHSYQARLNATETENDEGLRVRKQELIRDSREMLTALNRFRGSWGCTWSERWTRKHEKGSRVVVENDSAKGTIVSYAGPLCLHCHPAVPDAAHQ